DLLAEQDHALGPAFAGKARKVLRAARARQEADAGFRQRQLRVLLGDAQVAGQRAFEAAAHRVAVDRRDADAAERGQRLERLAETARRLARLRLVARPELLEIGAGGEELLAIAGDDEREDVALAVQHADQGAQRGQAVHGPRVRRRIAQRDDDGGVVLIELQARPFAGAQIHHRNSSSVSSRWRATITRMISLVPSRIWCTRQSRSRRSIGYSRV